MMGSPIAVTCIHTCGLHTQWILCLLHSVFILSHTSPTSIHDDKPFYLFHYEQCSDVDSNTLQAPNHKPHLTLPLTPKKKDFKCKFNAQYSDPESSHRDFYSEKKIEIANQLVLSCTEFEGIDINTHNLIEGYRPGYYMHIQLTNLPCQIIEYFGPIYPIIV